MAYEYRMVKRDCPYCHQPYLRERRVLVDDEKSCIICARKFKGGSGDYCSALCHKLSTPTVQKQIETVGLIDGGAKLSDVARKYGVSGTTAKNYLLRGRDLLKRAAEAKKYEMSEPTKVTWQQVFDAGRLQSRTANCLRNLGEENELVIDLYKKYTSNDLLITPNFGRKSLNQINDVLHELGLPKLRERAA